MRKLEQAPIDWNCRLPLQTEPAAACAFLLEMQERHGFSRFCLVSDYHMREHSVLIHRLRRERALRELKSQLPSSIEITAISALCIERGVGELDDLSELVDRRSGLLPITMPLCDYHDAIDHELHLLLHRRGATPLFLSFERCMLLYPEEIIEKLLRIRRAKFQFGYRALGDPKVLAVISRLMRENRTPLLGTALRDIQKARYCEIDHALASAKDALGEPLVRRLLAQNAFLWSKYVR